jgi:hypothetical protein
MGVTIVNGMTEEAGAEVTTKKEKWTAPAE